MKEYKYPFTNIKGFVLKFLKKVFEKVKNIFSSKRYRRIYTSKNINIPTI